MGSGNIGATNVFRTCGKKAGITVFILDLLKGFIPVILAVNFLGIEGKSPLMQFDFLESLRTEYPAAQRHFIQAIQVFSGLFAILGHNFSPWLGWKGGKGIATSAGVLIALMPVGFLLCMLVWAILFFITKYVAVASIGAAVALPLITLWGTHHHENEEGLSLWEAGEWNRSLLIFAIVAGVLAIWRHRGNIQRLLNGTEHQFKKKK